MGAYLFRAESVKKNDIIIMLIIATLTLQYTLALRTIVAYNAEKDITMAYGGRIYDSA
jgi:hypothetical protein